jgi:chaperonin GroES
MTTFTPLFDRVLLRRVVPEEVSKGGIYLPTITQTKKNEGEVVAVGVDAQGKLEVGQHVIVENWTGMEITLNGVDHLVIKAEECVGVVKEEQPN